MIYTKRNKAILTAWKKNNSRLMPCFSCEHVSKYGGPGLDIECVDCARDTEYLMAVAKLAAPGGYPKYLTD